MSKYKSYSSVAYTAQSIFDMPLQREPWLHARRLLLNKYDDEGKRTDTAVYWVVYVWDTREVVQFVEDKRTAEQKPSFEETSKRYAKAVDNAQPLKDPKKLVPNWAWEKLGSRRELYSMANEPQEGQRAFYNR